MRAGVFYSLGEIWLGARWDAEERCLYIGLLLFGGLVLDFKKRHKLTVTTKRPWKVDRDGRVHTNDDRVVILRAKSKQETKHG